MKHATDAALDRIEPLLAAIRAVPELRERKRGVFTRKSKAFLHFHEESDAVFADLRTSFDFERFGVNTARERRSFLAALRRAAAR